MEYSVEEISPVKKKVTVTVSPEEVDAAILGSVALYKDSARVDGFRKGKAPAGVIEKRFHDKIYGEAKENIINVHINEIVEKLGVTPVSGFEMPAADKPLEKGQQYVYSMEFETLPQFELPPYEGLEVEETKTELDDKEFARLLERFRMDKAKAVPAEGNGPAKDGQIVNVDFEVFENGKPIEDLKVSGFNLTLGKGDSLPDFEKLVKSIPSGHTGEGEIKFPDDFLDEKLAGKTVTMKVTVHSIKDLALPELNDSFAKNIGLENMENLNKLLRDSYMQTMGNLHKGEAQRKLLTALLKQTDFALPQSMVEMETRVLLTDMATELEKQGRGLSALGKSLQQLIEDARPQAEKMVRDQVFLLSVAKKENLEVTDRELATHIFNSCSRNGKDFKSVKDDLEKTGMIFHLRDRMLADKAMDLIYERAKVTLVDPVTNEAPASAPAQPTTNAVKTEDDAPEAKSDTNP